MKSKNFYMQSIENFLLNSDSDDIFFDEYPKTKVLKYDSWTKNFKENNFDLFNVPKFSIKESSYSDICNLQREYFEKYHQISK